MVVQTGWSQLCQITTQSKIICIKKKKNRNGSWRKTLKYLLWLALFGWWDYTSSFIPLFLPVLLCFYFILFYFILFYFILFYFIFCFLGLHPGYGSNWSYSWWSTSQPQQQRIRATSVIYTTVHGNAGSITHWKRSGIKPATSWFLVGFVSTAPQWELPVLLL